MVTRKVTVFRHNNFTKVKLSFGNVVVQKDGRRGDDSVTQSPTIILKMSVSYNPPLRGTQKVQRRTERSSPWLTKTRFDRKVLSNLSFVDAFYVTEGGLVFRGYEWRVIFLDTENLSPKESTSCGVTYTSTGGREKGVKIFLTPSPLTTVILVIIIILIIISEHRDCVLRAHKTVVRTLISSDWTIESSSTFKVCEVQELYRVWP